MIAALKRLFEKVPPRQRQWLTLGGIGVACFGTLYAVLLLASLGKSDDQRPTARSDKGLTPTNIGVMAPGQQVNLVDQWVGVAGRKLQSYEAEREKQDKINSDRKAFEESILKRFTQMEQRLAEQAKAPPASGATTPMHSAPATLPPPPALQGDGRMPPGAPPRPGAYPGSGVPASIDPSTLPPPAPKLVRVTVAERGKTNASSQKPEASTKGGTLDSYLPVSFTRGVLLGGLDAPTGGQAQSNPHPVLIRLSDNSVLPNRYRGEYRECFVIAAGYGDISAERAYMRTETLSCVRKDGSTLEVRIQGSVFGEDGKVGMRGRLVTKQGQMLANALTAGVISGIGAGFASYNTTVTASPWGAVASTGGADALRAGFGIGVGKALDRLAEYYIKLAEQTFPVIEVDAGREVDVVITKGVRIDGPVEAKPSPAWRSESRETEGRYLRVSDDDEY